MNVYSLVQGSGIEMCLLSPNLEKTPPTEPLPLLRGTAVGAAHHSYPSDLPLLKVVAPSMLMLTALPHLPK